MPFGFNPRPFGRKAPSSLITAVQEDPDQFAKGLLTAPFTAAPDILGLLGVGGRKLIEMTGGEAAPQIDNPISGDPIREAVGLDPNNVAGIVGEVADPTSTVFKGAGLLADAVRHAPEIASAAKGLLDPALAMTLFHGTPHKFNKFSLDAIGTGEGAQAYGHGLYFAENPGVAQSYQSQLASGRFVRADGEVFDPSDVLLNPNIRAVLQKTDGDIDAALDRVIEIQESIPGTEGARLAMEDANTLQMLKASGGIKREAGHLYEVDIPDETIDKMLDWDAKATDSIQLERAARSVARDVPDGIVAEMFGEGGMAMFGNGGDLYRSMATDLGGDAAASRLLNEAGIPGIRFLDGNSRSAGEGTRNIVVFNPDDIAEVKRDGLLVNTKGE